MEQITTAPAAQGEWGEGIRWQLYYSAEMPPPELVTAVFCVAVTNDNKVVLARSKRGWGLLGGHIEDGETPESALRREAKEEGGFVPDNPRLFACRKITADRPIPHQDPTKYYPFPVSYLAYYWAETAEPIGGVTGAEILESAAFTLEDMAALHTPDLPVIEAGFAAFLAHSRQTTGIP